MIESRVYHASILFYDGNVLVAGGGGGGLASFSSAEIHNATTRTFTAIGSMKYRREILTLTLLPSGKILATGGIDWTTNTYPNVSELYDPITKSLSNTQQLNTERKLHQTVLLNNSVLTIGGYANDGNTILSSCKKYYF